MATIVQPGASFASLGLGNSRWIEDYLSRAGITNPDHITALRAFYQGMSDEGLLPKFYGGFIHVHFLTNGNMARLNLLGGDFPLAFQNDIGGTHTTEGYQPSQANVRYAKSNYVVSALADLTNFHMHAYNTTSEAENPGAPLTVSKYLIGFFNSAQNFSALIQRNGGGNTRGGFGGVGQNVLAPASYPVTKKGLISIAKNGNNQAMYDGGVGIASSATAPTWTALTAPVEMCVGSVGATATWITDAKIFLDAAAPTDWSAANESSFNMLVESLKTVLIPPLP